MESEGTTLKQLNELARQFADVKKQKTETDTALKNIEALLEVLKTQIISLMTNEGLQSFKLEDIGLIYISMPARPKIIDKDGFFQWLEDNNEAYIIKPAVHHKTLGTWFGKIKDKYEKEGKDIQEELTGMLSVFEEPLLNLRRK